MTSVTERSGVLLVDHFGTFNQELINFVEGCIDSDWQKITPAEGWPVGVTARHIGVGHYLLISWVQMIVDGDQLPVVTMDDVNQSNDQHALDHANCTKAEVLEILQINADKMNNYIVTLDENDWQRESRVPLFDCSFSAADLFGLLLIDIATSHFDSMQAAIQS